MSALIAPKVAITPAGNAITRGDDVTLSFVITDAGVAVDLTGATIWFTAKWDPADPDAVAVIRKSSGVIGGVTIDPDQTANRGKGTLAIAAADTQYLTYETQLWMDMQVKDSTGKIHTLTAPKLRLTVEMDVTKATS